MPDENLHQGFRRMGLSVITKNHFDCASTGVVQTGQDTYLIAKKSPQVGFGPPIGVKGEAGLARGCTPNKIFNLY